MRRLCQQYSLICRLERQIAQQGEVYEAEGTNGETLLKANPAVAMLNAADRIFKAYLCEFPSSPLMRERFNAGGEDAPESPLSGFLN